ncbi:MAG TPA: nucleoside monophosphate kinase [Planctomycetaceae bacterium]|nr:nucleoside monophosphate kinase [Planctomycetaceae bacterium]
MHKYIIMGAQGCGKGTQAKLLKEDFDLVHISVGDIFRWHIQTHTKLAARIKRLIAEGNMVDDDVVENIIQERLADHDWNYGFILDGFPRNRTQAGFFLESYDIDAVIHIDVADEVVFDRVLARRMCSQCGLDYNLIHHRPAQPDRCDVCGGTLTMRDDDNPDAVRARLKDYRTKTEPILELFGRKELVIQTNGNQTVAEIQADIRRQLKLPSKSAG